MTLQSSRRAFLAASSAAAAALLIPIPFDAFGQSSPTPPPARTPASFLRIGTDGRITLLLPTCEMGQGTHTGQAQIIAEELGADWSSIEIDMPKQPHSDYRLPFGQMRSVGSFGIRFWHDPMRRAAAQAREMLTEAAARRLGVEIASLTVRDGFVIHAASRRRLGFGELAVAAMALPVPPNPALRPAAERTLTGRTVQRLDTAAKITGNAVFAIDVKRPGMLHGAVRLAPVHSAQVARLNEASVRGLPGVVAVARVPNGAVVIADTWWQAKQAADKLDIQFTATAADTLSSAEIDRRLRSALDRTDVPVSLARGDVERAFAGRGRVVEAEYAVPMLAHVCMEPITCTAEATAGRTELWIGTQGHDTVRMVLERTLQIPAEQLFINTTFLGGGFGRRTHGEIAVHAVAASRAVGGRPVKVAWAREDDIQQGQYRQAMMARFRAMLGEDGRIAALRMRIAGPQMGRAYGVDPDAVARARGYVANVDPFSLSGLIDMHYGVPHVTLDHAVVDLPILFCPWRSIANSFTGFFLESFVDECAAAMGQDPLAFRRAHLADKPRMLAVLDRVAEMAEWQRPARPGITRGLAVVESYDSYVAEVVEISLAAGQPKVERVHVAVDCGRAINPGQVQTQMQGAVIEALGAAMRVKITIADGRTEQSNFHDYPILRIGEVPRIDVAIVETGSPLGGVGEPGVPPLAPALMNALHAAAGRRIRSTPLADHGLA
ncbi:xanthine dehydrogenase family protein molybdopterin-binding subunit [Bradyrhizobium yuanmingense]|uniref:xanthine dehydrogenase family protein molybdopterin-binding subunit n=1 Tax=Bradyrhizobium yuanmingense TaxID=108015 RepID=UPI0023B8D243|nr:molybdopterin cofactor-binding domain-containing protein [Bradyrhizobium yuanmingense]MDF0494141.1 molybdopterin-dependent oxidoreductase [Bradyrhizobium yuanmingense]